MANVISLPESFKRQVEPICMSNGLTTVFLEVLTVSGSILAATDREKEFVIWLSQRDQSAVGIGTVGFDIAEMPWTADSFEIEKSFMIDIISNAAKGLGWERLSYTPNREQVADCLNRFRLMIEAFGQTDVDRDSYADWANDDEGGPMIPKGYPKCENHDVYLNCHGCLLCNNEG